MNMLDKVKSFEMKCGLKIPKGFTVLDNIGGHDDNIVVKRRDGFTVFLNEKDHTNINYIRLHAKQKDVIMAVGLYRGMQIADNYKKKYAHFKNQKDINYINFVNDILQSVSKIKLISGGDESENMG